MHDATDAAWVEMIAAAAARANTKRSSPASSKAGLLVIASESLSRGHMARSSAAYGYLSLVCTCFLIHGHQQSAAVFLDGDATKDVRVAMIDGLHVSVASLQLVCSLASSNPL